MPKHLGKLNKLHKNASMPHMTSVHECISDMNSRVRFMIGCAGVYYEDDESEVLRMTSAGNTIYAYDDIDDIGNAANKLIVIIDNHNRLK